MKKLFLDIETYSSVDLATCGAYKYTESPDFAIILLAYAFDDDPPKIVDVELEGYPEEFLQAMRDPDVIKLAYNAQFERICFRRVGMDIPSSQWECIMIKALYCGYPASLELVSEVMQLGEKGKLSVGKALIRLFCKPDKGGQKVKPGLKPEDWKKFQLYCINDVVSEREIYHRLSPVSIPDWERRNYLIDQDMNDRGVLIDMPFVKNAIAFDEKFSSQAFTRLKKITGLENPNSVSQLKDWLSENLGEEIKELTKDSIRKLLPEVDGEVRDVLVLRQLLSKSSIKKYLAMENCVGEESRARGMFQLYGANRTGRWTSRLIQLQSLPQNHMPDLDLARRVVAERDYDLAGMLWDNLSNVLSELIRTAFVAPKGKVFAVADFSAIEARVISWVAREEWRLDVFRTHGKIYEASASLMFGVPIESVTKGSELRQRGKTSELALGYAGGVEALTRMDREERISDAEKPGLVHRWRKANPGIVKLWKDIEDRAKHTIVTRRSCKLRELSFAYENDSLTIQLPSGRKLFYVSPGLGSNRWGKESITYMGINQTTKQWFHQETYGGKLVENIVQAIARDALAESLQGLKAAGYEEIVMTIHDEVVIEVPDGGADDHLKKIIEIMEKKVSWMEGLPLKVDGYVTPYYRKD